jgi:S1-C subfamily serine protease
VVGSPKGLTGSLSDGLVAAIRENGTILQITAPISPGSSGSPIMNSEGRVIGIARAMIRGGQNLNLAISVSKIQAKVAEARARDKPQPFGNVADKADDERAQLETAEDFYLEERYLVLIR